jgi:hypothetical protein
MADCVLSLADFLGAAEITEAKVLEYHGKNRARRLKAHHKHVVHIQCEAASDCVAMTYDATMRMRAAKQPTHDLSVRDKKELKRILRKVRQGLFATTISAVPSSSTSTKRGHNGFAAALARDRLGSGPRAARQLLLVWARQTHARHLHRNNHDCWQAVRVPRHEPRGWSQCAQGQNWAGHRHVPLLCLLKVQRMRQAPRLHAPPPVQHLPLHLAQRRRLQQGRLRRIHNPL